MKTELKDAWQDALLSGLYEQGEGTLNANGKYCCLGVLCEVAIDLGYPVVRGGSGTSSRREFSYMVESNDEFQMPAIAILTEHLLELFDMSEGTQYKFSEANDNGATFAEIVDMMDELV